MFHKFGFHVNRSGDDVFDAIQRIKPAVIKTLEHDIGFWRRVREIPPQCLSDRAAHSRGLGTVPVCSGSGRKGARLRGRAS